jgi:hypothetical protein
MKTLIVSCGLATAALLAVSPGWADAPDRAAEGRVIATEFGAELRARLQAAMAEGGPLAAIRVCNQDAPRIAREASAQSGALVARTALKPRNPVNQPDAHEHSVLAAFEAELAENPDGPPPERLDVLEDGSVRFMSAIVTQPPCLVCHGETLAPPVAAEIDALYPDDAARGHRVGDLRGAFTITWPAARAP